MAHDLETRQRFLELRSQGCSYDKIAQELHVAKRTLIAWGLELKDQLAALRALRFDDFLEQAAAHKEKRIELLILQRNIFKFHPVHTTGVG